MSLVVAENTEGVLKAIRLFFWEITERPEWFILFPLTQPSPSGEGFFWLHLKCVHRLALKGEGAPTLCK